ncbi:hypothetical protein GX51_00371 [Blastomyces parvus]|uniref:Uncharacterized protein n=1 Tax=Blastomyces parvus TaxID=2060905 RepID=A0A2B7XEL7_9EURO|nr:hypothetical protein GX51_00371 [Blastomyces parvus]
MSMTCFIRISKLLTSASLLSQEKAIIPTAIDATGELDLNSRLILIINSSASYPSTLSSSSLSLPSLCVVGVALLAVPDSDRISATPPTTSTSQLQNFCQHF